ncbi:MAG: GNAT family N-acetyltransferase [Leptospiraceae bacterium]|nr:GNAT family N-acetyltransferase [Leptospiraceae bacterium]
MNEKISFNNLPILQIDSISLVPITENDFEKLYSVASDPLIWEQHPNYDRYKREVFQLYFDGAIASKSAFLIYEINDNQKKVIGSTRYYDYNSEASSVCIGYTFLAKEYWGGIYNRNIKKVLIDYAFQKVDRILFHIGEKNIRSQKSILKIGATRIEDVYIDSYGKKVLSFQYQIKKSDWENKNN